MHEAIGFGFPKNTNGTFKFSSDAKLVEEEKKKFGHRHLKVSCQTIHNFLNVLGIPRRNEHGNKLGLKKRLAFYNKILNS